MLFGDVKVIQEELAKRKLKMFTYAQGKMEGIIGRCCFLVDLFVSLSYMHL